MKVGSRAGMSFLLDPRGQTTIGRGDDCTITVADPLSSRVHAIVSRHDGRWWVKDQDSRNGTFVNDAKIDEAALADGNYLRVGATEFSFHHCTDPPTVAFSNSELLQEVVRDTVMDAGGTAAHALAAIGDTGQAHDLLLLYQLSIKLLGCSDPMEVVRFSLELLRDHTRASVVGFLWIDEQGELRPKLTIPAAGQEQIPLSQALTRLVSQEGHAVWIANQQSRERSAQLQHYADALCVPLLSQGEVLGAVHAYLERGRFRQSQFDFAISLANITAVALVRARHTENLQTSLSRLQEKSASSDEIVGSSAPMRELKARIQRVAATSGCVLIRGESGVGKELVARAVHLASPRADRPMLSVNCAAIPHDLMESQLFGHRAGAFTGADRDHAGYFQQADLGTLFLDEIGELTLPGQAKLLRILEGHPFLPVGATQEIKVDVRVIAATNQDLQTYVRDKQFRADLFYRLSVFELNVPPLRQRGEDIAALIDHFLDHFRRQHGRPELKLSDDARQRLLSYHWPGNVRQLRNVMDSAVVLAVGHEIEVSDLGLRDAGGGELETLRFDYWERRLIDEALRRTSGNVPESAKLLGIGRATLYRKLDEYGIQR
ncbi:MAG: sigma 54-interacting transcriptional regulator [Pirellulales bacterium]|nr:sigma 54-interacting transcriptional regulator [Pirellulales bacterium]